MGKFPSNNAQNGLYTGPHVWLLPFIEQQNIFNFMYSAGNAWTSPYNMQTPKTYVCPADPTQQANSGYTSYADNAVLFGNGQWNGGSVNFNLVNGGLGYARFPASLPDGTSNTIVWTEKLATCGGGNANYWATTCYNCNNDLPAVGYFVQPMSVQFQTGASQTTCIGYQYPTSGHTAAILAGLGDGSVRMIAKGMSTNTFNLALIPNDGLPMPSDW